jgi:Putative prokaryotic signal transducing protein
MKKLYSAQDPLMIAHLKNVLEASGIDCVVKNTYLSSAAGEIPPIECWPELWVLKDARYAEARKILGRTLTPLRPVSKPWSCSKCGKEVEGQFSECWNCGSSRPPLKAIRGRIHRTG